MVFAESVKIQGDEVTILSDPYWVKQDEMLKFYGIPLLILDYDTSLLHKLYEEALVLRSPSQPNGEDGVSAIKVSFLGKMESDASYGYGHLGKYSTQIEIMEIISSSIPIH